MRRKAIRAIVLSALVLTAAAQVAPAGEMVTTTSVNIRTAPENGAVIKTVPAGTRLEIESAYAGWAKTSDGGYICAKYLTDKNAPKGKTFKLPKKTKVGSSFEDKVKALKKEAKSAKWHYSGSGILCYSNRYTEDSGKTFFLTRILIKDPSSQMGQDFSNGDFGGTREYPTDAAKRLGAVVTTNGSYFSYETGQPACASVFVNKGQVVRGSSANGKEICLLSERTAIGCVEPGEYYIITAGSSAYSGGLTFQDLQDMFMDLGCSYARSLDGGGSSSLVFDGELINTPAAGEQRPVVDFLYFVPEN